jgi:hypothetical protein
MNVNRISLLLTVPVLAVFLVPNAARAQQHTLIWRNIGPFLPEMTGTVLRKEAAGETYMAVYPPMTYSPETVLVDDAEDSGLLELYADAGVNLHTELYVSDVDTVAGGTAAFAAPHQAEVGFSFSDVIEFDMLLDPASGYVYGSSLSWTNSFVEGHWQLIDTTTCEDPPYAPGTPITCSLFFDAGWAHGGNTSYTLVRDWNFDVDLTDVDEVVEDEEFTEAPIGRFRVRTSPGGGTLFVWRRDPETGIWDYESISLSGATGSIHEEYQFPVEVVTQGLRFFAETEITDPIYDDPHPSAFAVSLFGEKWRFSGLPESYNAAALVESSLQVTAADID